MNKKVDNETIDICLCGHPKSEHANVKSFCEHFHCHCSKYRPKFKPNDKIGEDLL